MTPNDAAPSNECQLDRVIAEYFAAVEEGQPPDRQPFMDAHPEHAAELRVFFADYDRVQIAARQKTLATETVAFSRELTPGSVIGGRYKLQENIGEGGMGSVWVAEQQQPVKRKVAIKLIKAGMDSRQVLARFEAERQALAVMDHPHIAKVFDGGLTEQGRPYFVMEYMKGIPITEYCDRASLSLRDRLSLFIPICRAVQHAHQKGIVHRDLKPSNILICLYDGQPVPKVIDFGLAKALHQPLTELSINTGHGVMVGTPVYMSPEQAEYNNLDVDTRTDVYSLGVVLYELLTGTTPLEREQVKLAAYDEILRLIKDVEPARPSLRLSGSEKLPGIAAQRGLDPRQLCRSLAGDLDWIVMKALEKERSRRYDTADNVARDIERFLNEEAVEARPPSTIYRLRKFVRKHRREVFALAAILFALVLGTVGTTIGLIRARQAEKVAVFSEQNAINALGQVTLERDAKEAALRAEAQLRAEAERQRQTAVGLEETARKETLRARRYLYAAEINMAEAAWNADNLSGLQQILARQLPGEKDLDLRGFEWHYWNRLLHTATSSWKLPVADDSEINSLPILSSDGTRIAVSVWDDSDAHRAEVWDVTTKQRLASFDIGRDVRPCAFSPDGTKLAIATHWPAATRPDSQEIRVVDVATKAEILRVATDLELTDAGSLAFSPNSRQLTANVIRHRAAGAEETVDWVVWDLASGQEIAHLDCPGFAPTRLVFSQDGKRIAGIVCKDSSRTGTHARVWDIEAGALTTEFPAFEYWNLEDVDLSPDGSRLAGIERNFDGETTIYEWDVATGEELNRIERQTFELDRVRFCPKGEFLIGLGGLSIMVWESQWNQPEVRLAGHETLACDIGFSPDGHRMTSVDDSGTVLQWDLTDLYPAEEEEAGPSGTRYYDSVFAVDRQRKRHAYYGSALGDPAEYEKLTVVDANDVVLAETPLIERGHYVHEKLFFSPGGELLIALTSDREQDNAIVMVFDAVSLREIRRWTFSQSETVWDIDVNREGTRLAMLIEGEQARVQVMEIVSGSTVSEILLAPWTARDGTDCRSGLAWSPDGQLLAIALDDGGQTDGEQHRMLVVDAVSGRIQREWQGGVPPTSSPVFSPDGLRLAVGVDNAFDGLGPAVVVWDVQSGSQMNVLTGHRNLIISVAFSPDNQRLASASWHDGDEQGELILWDLSTGQPVATWADLDHSPTDQVYFTPDGHQLFTPSMTLDGTPVP